MPPVTFVTLHEDLVAINSTLIEIRNALTAPGASMTDLLNFHRTTFEWLHDQDPTEIVLEP